MNRKLIVSAVMAVFLASTGSAFAQRQGNADRGDRGGDQQMQPRDQHQQMHSRDQQSGQRDNRGRDQQMQSRGQRDRNSQARYDQRREGRGAGPNHAFYRGQRLPTAYRHRQYVVDDWRGHHLSAPPRGYHWVQTGADFVLVAVATGVILQLLLAN